MLGVLSDCIWKVSVRSFAIEVLWQRIFRDLANINFSDTIQAVLGSWSVETSENVSAQKTAEVWKQKIQPIPCQQRPLSVVCRLFHSPPLIAGL